LYLIYYITANLVLIYYTIEYVWDYAAEKKLFWLPKEQEEKFQKSKKELLEQLDQGKNLEDVKKKLHN
jgi:hypothetical protein